MFPLYSHFPKKSIICKFFTTWCFDVRFWDLLYFICLKFNPQYWHLLRRGGGCVDLVVIFNKGREETFMASLQNCKSCVCIKYLTLVRPRKLIPWILRFYTRCKMHRTQVLLKKYIAVILQLFKQIKLCLWFFLFTKICSPQKNFMSCFCLRHGAYLNSTSNVFTYLLIIFLGNDWPGVFLIKWRSIRSTS